MDNNHNTLRNHNRERTPFSTEFGVESSVVISEMDKSGNDIPYQQPQVPLTINHAGVIRENVPLHIVNPFHSGSIVVLHSKITLHTAVPPSNRGLHMSRIGDIVAKVSSQRYDNLQDCTLDLVKRLSESQYKSDSCAEIEAVFSYIEDVPHWLDHKSKKSLETVTLFAISDIVNNRVRQNAGLEFSNLTACPCVQQTYRHALVATGKAQNPDEQLLPLLTHSQRCHTKIIVKDLPEALDFVELLAVLDQTIVRVQNTLPRDFELLMVHRAHKTPQFMEDVIRDVFMNVYRLYKDRYAQSAIEVSTISFESIHDFNIQAKIEYRFDELQHLLQSHEDTVSS